MTTAQAPVDPHSAPQVLLERIGALAAADQPIAHALLFHGPAGAGKHDAALSLAASLLTREGDDRAAILGRIQRGSHPDFTLVTPSGAREMLRGDIQEPVVAALPLTPFEAPRRVFVIEHADTMNEEATAAMLKSLEEPPSYAHLILTATRMDRVTPTIVSRCQVVRFAAPTTAQITASLIEQGISAETAEACSRLSSGDRERAEFLASDNGIGLRKTAIEFVRRALRAQPATPWEPIERLARKRGEALGEAIRSAHADDLELAGKRERKQLEKELETAAHRADRRGRSESIGLALELMVYWLRDLILLSSELDSELANCDRLDELREDREDLGDIDGARLELAIEHCDRTRGNLNLNVGEGLALQGLYYELGG